MLKNKIKVVKDGSKIRVLVNEVDTSVPAIQLIGHEYVFNSKIVSDTSFSAFEFSNLVGFNSKKQNIEWDL